MGFRTFALTVGLLGAAVATGLADSKIEYKVTEGQNAVFQAMFVGQGKIRTDTGNSTSVILDPTGGAMTVVDHAKKTFTRLTRADIEQLAKTMDDMMAKMEQAMASMPPEMRERMKGMMGGASAMTGAAVEVTDTGERSTVAGRPCRIFRTKIAGRVVRETCMGAAAAIELPSADRATLTACMAWSKELSERLTKGVLAQFGNASPFRGGMVPLRLTEIAADGSRSTSEFSGVSTASIPAETFAVPSGYKEQKIEIPRMGRGGA
jgi:hypothetical protein